jgi:hypothetical protein
MQKNSSAIGKDLHETGALFFYLRKQCALFLAVGMVSLAQITAVASPIGGECWAKPWTLNNEL